MCPRGLGLVFEAPRGQRAVALALITVLENITALRYVIFGHAPEYVWRPVCESSNPPNYEIPRRPMLMRRTLGNMFWTTTSLIHDYACIIDITCYQQPLPRRDVNTTDPLHVWFYGRVFGVGGSNGAVYGWSISERAAGRHVEKFRMAISQQWFIGSTSRLGRRSTTKFVCMMSPKWAWSGSRDNIFKFTPRSYFWNL